MNIDIKFDAFVSNVTDFVKKLTWNTLYIYSIEVDGIKNKF